MFELNSIRQTVSSDFVNIFLNLLAQTQKCDLTVTFIVVKIKVQSLQTKSIN